MLKLLRTLSQELLCNSNLRKKNFWKSLNEIELETGFSILVFKLLVADFWQHFLLLDLHASALCL